MKNIFLLSVLIFLSNIIHAKPIAGKMDEKAICTQAGFLVKKAMGSKTKVYEWPCSAKSTDGFKVELESGYQTGLMKSPFRYTARGYIKTKSLVISEIRVHGIDSDFIPFCEFDWNMDC